MSEPAIFILIRDGQPRFFADRWASVFLHREILWGPEEFEAWATAHEELDAFEEDCAGGVAVDYDQRRLWWCGYAESLQVPRVDRLYHRLLQAAWPGFEVRYAEQGMAELAKLVGYDMPPVPLDEYRLEAIEDVARDYADDDPDDDEEYEDEEPRYSDGERRAWVTLLDSEGVVRHWQLDEISLDILLNDGSPMEALARLSPAEVPPEVEVAEGIWIDQSKQMIGVWGSPALQTRLDTIREHWHGWTVIWAERGYGQQCEVAGPVGEPLSDEAALAQFLPVVLSTKQFNLSSIMSSLGGGLKRTAMKATGCLVIVLCVPIVVFGLISGDWTSVGITCAVVVVLAIGTFKIVEYRFSRWFKGKIPQPDSAGDPPPVAGPLDERARRQRVDALLAIAKLPPLAKIEPLFPEESELDALD
jgi:hypothetical protein